MAGQAAIRYLIDLYMCIRSCFCSLTLLLVGMCTQYSNAQTLRRDYAFGGSDQEFGVGVLPTSNAGLLFGGSTFSAVSGEVTQPSPAPVNSGDFWLLQTDAQGTKQWDKRYGGSGDDRLIKLLPTADGGYMLCGWTNSPAGYDLTEPARGSDDYWVVKIDAQGTKQWDRRFGSAGSDMLATAVAAPDGSFLLVGTTTPDALGNAPGGDRTQAVRGPSDIWLVKIDAAGNKQWDKCLSSLRGDYAYEAINTPGGFLLGASIGASSGGIITPGGDVSGTSQGGHDFWLVKVSDQGDKVWDRLYGGSGHEDMGAMLATPDGGALIGCRSSSLVGGDKSIAAPGKNIWLLKLDAQGTKQWDKVYGFGSTWPDDDILGKLVANPRGGYFIGGHTTPTSSLSMPDYNIGIISIDAAGTQQWQRIYGGNGQDYFTDILAGTNQTLVLSQSTSDSGRDKTANSRGQFDIWALEISNPVLANQAAFQPPSPSVTLYPNPVSNEYITLQITDNQDNSPTHATIYNSQGQLMQYVAINDKSSLKIDVSSLSAGLYTIVIQLHMRTLTRHFTKL
jgi:Secretion system C-terminal sorting domain